MLKIKFVLLLMLLFFIVDSKKLRNKLTTKYHCSTYRTKCGMVYGECCPGFNCEDDCFLLIFCRGICR